MRLCLCFLVSLPLFSMAFVSRPALMGSSRANSAHQAIKGFGSEPEKKREKSVGQIKREEQSNKYDQITKSGGQEYNIYVRQFGSDEKSWLPTRIAVSVPRGAQVSDAIYSNVDAIRQAIVRLYPKLRGSEDEFEFGFNLKIYPDDPIEVAFKNKPRAQGLSFGNWINTLLSPIDTSNMPRSPKQD